jgi:hypothetical protein
MTQEQRDTAAVTRQQRLEEKRDRQEVAGIPDNPLAGVETDTNPVLDLHVGGMLVRDLPECVQKHIRRCQTDEGIAADNEGKDPRRVEIGADGFAKALDQRRDDVKVRDYDSYEARDPLKEVADAYAVPGMRPKFLSPKGVKDRGGTGDHVVVKDEKGDPVTVRGMVLGHMPEARAESRNKHYRDRGNNLLKQITTTYAKEGGVTAVVDQ